MALRIPVPEILDVSAAGRPRSVTARVGFRRTPEDGTPVRAPPEAECGIERVSGFVAQNSASRAAVAALGFAAHPPLELRQTRVSGEERNRNARNAVRGKPFGRKPHMWPEQNFAPRQRLIQVFDIRSDITIVAIQSEISEPQPQ
jgi:hypothetical protein